MSTGPAGRREIAAAHASGRHGPAWTTPSRRPETNRRSTGSNRDAAAPASGPYGINLPASRRPATSASPERTSGAPAASKTIISAAGDAPAPALPPGRTERTRRPRNARCRPPSSGRASCAGASRESPRRRTTPGRLPATVRLTPSSATEPFVTTYRPSPGGIENVKVQELPVRFTRRIRERPSTCPRTKCPERRSPHRSARSRLTPSPSARRPRRERRSVSWERSATSRRPPAIAVRQTPSTATLSPRASRPKRAGGAIVSLRPPFRRETSTTVPMPATIPVNMRPPV